MDRFDLAERFAKGQLSKAEASLCEKAGKLHSDWYELDQVLEEVEDAAEDKNTAADSGSESSGSSGSAASVRSASGSEAGGSQAEAEVALVVAASVAGDEGKVPEARAKHADKTTVFRHCVRRTVHFGRLGCADRLACGKSCPMEVYERVPSEDGVPWPRCADCFLL